MKAAYVAHTRPPDASDGTHTTINDLLHASALELKPIADRIIQLVRKEDVVRADETSMRVQKQKKRGFFWTFLAESFSTAENRGTWLVGYHFSLDRSGATPADILGGTIGNLVIDGYTGYNRVLSVKGRRRCACLAHVRRKFHDALDSCGDAKRALELILNIYRVEHEAKARGIVGTAEHLALRRDRGRKAMREFGAWLKEQKPLHLPKGPMGEAIGYAIRQWKALCRFLKNPKIPVDNNSSERMLRAIALGRKNYLHVGNKDAGSNLAVLYTLVATCEANGVNPLEYLRDVLIQVKTTPTSKIDELLPHRWAHRRSNGGVPAPAATAAQAPSQEQVDAVGDADSTQSLPNVEQNVAASGQGPKAKADCAPTSSVADGSMVGAQQKRAKPLRTRASNAGIGQPAPERSAPTGGTRQTSRFGDGSATQQCASATADRCSQAEGSGYEGAGDTDVTSRSADRSAFGSPGATTAAGVAKHGRRPEAPGRRRAREQPP